MTLVNNLLLIVLHRDNYLHNTIYFASFAPSRTFVHMPLVIYLNMYGFSFGGWVFNLQYGLWHIFTTYFLVIVFRCDTILTAPHFCLRNQQFSQSCDEYFDAVSHSFQNERYGLDDEDRQWDSGGFIKPNSTIANSKKLPPTPIVQNYLNKRRSSVVAQDVYR